MIGRDDEEARIIALYERIEAAITEIVTIEGRSGILAEYLILSSVQMFDEESGSPITNTGWHTNPNIPIPYHRLLGLLTYNTKLLEREILDDE